MEDADGGCGAGRRVRRPAGGQQRLLKGAWVEAADAQERLGMADALADTQTSREDRFTGSGEGGEGGGGREAM